MTVLLPCPFCGCTPEIEQTKSGMWGVCCENSDCRPSPSTFAGSTVDAIFQWNQREQKQLSDQQMWDIAVATAGSILVGWDDTVVLDIERPSDLSEVVRAILAAMK